MTFSVGILYSVQEFLKFVNETPLKTTEFISYFERFTATSPSLILEVAENSNWIKVNMDSNVSITTKGKEILLQQNMRDALRVQLVHLIGDTKPSWSFLIHKGRKEAFQYFPSNVQQCFKEAELINSYEPEIVKWWDDLASVARGKVQDSQLEVGRKGEILSLQYEKNRIGKEVFWQSVESNLSGYDILSSVSSTDKTPLRIEVKATTNNSDKFTFYLSRNEWQVAESSLMYHFHFWILGKQPELFVIDKSDLIPNIPLNQGYGVWENTKIVIEVTTLSMLNRKGQ